MGSTRFEARNRRQSVFLTERNRKRAGPLELLVEVSSYSDEYFLTAYLDGSEQLKISGEVNWQQRHIAIPPGSHQVEWVYAKGFFGVLRADAAWLDQIEFVSESSGLSKLPQSIMWEPRDAQAVTFPTELYASAVVEGPAFMRGHILVPTGSGSVRVRATQPGNNLFAPAEPVEQNIVLEAAPPAPLAADTPGMSINLHIDHYRRVQAIAFQPDGKVIIVGSELSAGQADLEALRQPQRCR